MDLNNVKELAIQGKDVFTLYVNNGLAWKKNHGFKVVAKQANSTIQLTAVGTPDAITLVKSTDEGITFSPYNVGDVITLANIGDSVILEAGVNGNTRMGKSTSVYHQFVMTGKVEIEADKLNFLLNQYGVVDSIPSYAYTGLFYDCQSMEGTIDLSWITIGSGANSFRFAFRNTGATSVDLSNMTSITSEAGFYGAFYGCLNLTSVDLSNLASVSANYGMRNAFSNCTSLKKVSLKKLSSTSGTEPMRATFSGCTALEVIDMSEATAIPSIDSNTFNSTNSTFQIVVPDALYSTWIAATNWSSLASQIVKVSDYTPAS